MVTRQEVQQMALLAGKLAGSLSSLADRVESVAGELLPADVFPQVSLIDADRYALGHGPSGVIVIVPRQESDHKTKSVAVAALRAAVASIGAS